MSRRVKEHSVGDVVDISLNRSARVMKVGRVGKVGSVGYILKVLGTHKTAGEEIFRHDFEVYKTKQRTQCSKCPWRDMSTMLDEFPDVIAAAKTNPSGFTCHTRYGPCDGPRLAEPAYPSRGES